MTVGSLFHQLAGQDGNRSVLVLPIEIDGRGPAYSQIVAVEPAMVRGFDGTQEPVVLLRTDVRDEDA